MTKLLKGAQRYFNKVCADLSPGHAWHLEIGFVCDADMCVFMSVCPEAINTKYKNYMYSFSVCLYTACCQ